MKAIVSAPSRAEQSYLAIRESIVDGTLAPGDHLVQEELAAQLGVSRQPIQQAMALLKSDGLVIETRARGLRVSPLDPVETAHRYQIRAALEQLAARQVAERAASSPDFARQLAREGERMLESGNAMVDVGRHREAVDHDVAFHSFIYEASGNPLLASTAEVHWLYLRRVMIAVLRFADRGPIVWAQHADILRALCRGRVDESVALVTAHVYGAEGALTDALRRMASEQERADKLAV